MDPRKTNLDFTQNREIPLDLVKTRSSKREGFTKILLSRGFDPGTVDILIPIWRQEKISNYSQYTNEWFTFSFVNNISPVKPPAQVALAFLTSLIKKGKSYN